VHPDDQEDARTRLHQLAAGQKTGRFESRLRHKDGSYRWLAWEAATDRNRIYAMGRDITDLKRAEQERKRLDEIEDMHSAPPTCAPHSTRWWNSHRKRG
jgi:hypothetical protein